MNKKPEEIIGTISPLEPIRDLTISQVLTNAIKLIYEVAIILFIFMVLFSALQWILSGGDKEKVASARGRLTYAVIGLVILGLAGVIISTLGKITGIGILGI